MKSRDGKSQRREEKKKKDQKRESLRRKKIQVREKVGKSRNTVFFQWFVALEGRRVGSLSTPLWCEAHFEVKMHKTPHVRTTFGSWDVKSARRCGAKHICQWKMKKKTPHIRSTFRSCDVEKCTPLSRKAHFEVKMYKTPQLRTTFGSWDVEKVHAVVARSTFWSQKWKKPEGFGALLDVQMSFCTWGFCRISKNDGRLGTFEEDLQRCIFRGRRSTRDRDDFAWQVQHFVWPVSLFCGRRSSLDKCSGKITKRIGTRPSALHSTFHIWRKSRRIASFLMLST